jgi:hypothetical protein
VRDSPRQSGYVLGTDAAHSTAARQNTARGPFLRQHPSRTLGIKHPSSSLCNRPRTLSTGGMSYSKLPSGACRLIRSLRVIRLVDVQDTESNISPNRNSYLYVAIRGFGRPEQTRSACGAERSMTFTAAGGQYRRRRRVLAAGCADCRIDHI